VSEAATAPTYVPIGDVIGPHGVRGLVRIRLFNVTSAVLASRSTIDLEGPDAPRATFAVRRATPHGGDTWLVELDTVADRTAAEQLRGRRVLVPADELPALDADEFYHHELVGFEVETATGARVGTVTGTMATGLNDVWLVRDGRREHLIPVIADVVVTIDRPGRRIVIVPLDGLLD
jgi:16S rRNA processing protein RimM